MDPKIERLERMIKSGHIFNKHDWHEGDFSCPRVHSPSEKAIIKDYEAAILRRKQKAKLLANRKRNDDEAEEHETSSKRSRQEKKPRLLVLQDQCGGKSRKVKGRDNFVGLKICEAVQEMNDFLEIQFAAVIQTLRLVEPAPARRLINR